MIIYTSEFPNNHKWSSFHMQYIVLNSRGHSGASVFCFFVLVQYGPLSACNLSRDTFINAFLSRIGQPNIYIRGTAHPCVLSNDCKTFLWLDRLMCYV